jgi:hypothetical protein
MKRIILALAIVSIFAACNSKKEKKAEEIQNPYKGKITATVPCEGEINIYSNDINPSSLGIVKPVDGKFTFEFDFKVPRKIRFRSKDLTWGGECWADTTHVTFVSKGGTLETKVKGGALTRGEEHFFKAMKEYKKDWPNLMYLNIRSRKEKAAARKKELEDSVAMYKKMHSQLEIDYIKNNPKNIYCASIIKDKLVTKIGGQKAGDLKPIFDLLDPSIHTHPYVADVKRIMDEMLQSEVGLEHFIPNAKDTRYKVDKTYEGLDHQYIYYMSVFKDDKICALVRVSSEKGQKAKPGDIPFVKIIDLTGKEFSRFEITEKGDPTTVAVDENDLIYVTVTDRKVVEKKVRGKVTKFTKALGANCLVYNKAGELQKTYKLEGLEDVSGLRIFGNQLIVSSCQNKNVRYYNKETGAPIREIADLRPCCSIMDMDVDQEGNLLVANLGSFRVTVYDTKGNKTISFGQRGKGVNDFSGCCNPVSLRKLKNNCIVTVEKTPTRIKVYSKDGAHIIQGIEELVNGCYHIPIMSDSKDNIYLASPDKGIVKCVEAV